MTADELRARAARASLQACLATPDRTQALRQLRVPTLVVHGTADNLIGVRGATGHSGCDPARGAGRVRRDGPRAAAALVARPGRPDRRPGPTRGGRHGWLTWVRESAHHRH